MATEEEPVSNVMFVRRACLATTLCAVLLPAGTSRAASFGEFIDPHPAPGNQFGSHIVPLSTGNVVITSPYDDAGGNDAGAVYLFNGATGALISTLRGNKGGDNVGIDGVTVLANGNFVVASPNFDNGLVIDGGAATWCSGTTGVNGAVSAANSLVGTVGFDQVGSGYVVALTNGNYVVGSPMWNRLPNFRVGAVTWGNGTTGISGAVSLANSLVGSRVDDRVGEKVMALSNGNYVVGSWLWDSGTIANAGAATWGNGAIGVSGAVSAANSLVGSNSDDHVSDYMFRLSNGNYVVASPRWNNGFTADAGAVTWCNGTTGKAGVISAANSLVGTTADDNVGFGSFVPLPNGNYVIGSVSWDNGAVVDAGAATWGSGTTGVTGVVSAANSLVGSTAADRLGYEVTELANGNYVVTGRDWDNSAVGDSGAVDAGFTAWGNGMTGVSGVISAANSLVGTTAGEGVGYVVTALANGNYVVGSPGWDNGALVDVGAATWGNGTTGVSGVISTTNSLVGSSAHDVVGATVAALTNGNYVVGSSGWDDDGVADVGAATWADGTTGLVGVVSPANSLVGSQTGDCVGTAVTALTNGNYVVVSMWDNGGAADAGATTWGDGTTGVTGVVSEGNSVVGSSYGDGASMTVTPLSNGNYVVARPFWHNGAVMFAGAVSWGDGAFAATGVVSSANSLVGLNANDFVGSHGVTELSNGNYVVASPAWDRGAVVDAGAATLGDGASGSSGGVSAASSLVGAAENSSLALVVVDAVNNTYIASFLTDGGGRVRVSSQDESNLVSVADNLEPAQRTIGIRPNPARGNALHVAFALPTAGPARLELLDVSGRRVLAREVGSLGSGQHTVNLAEGRRVAPGIYWVRLTQGASQQRARVAVIE